MRYDLDKKLVADLGDKKRVPVLLDFKRFHLDSRLRSRALSPKPDFQYLESRISIRSILLQISSIGIKILISLKTKITTSSA